MSKTKIVQVWIDEGQDHVLLSDGRVFEWCGDGDDWAWGLVDRFATDWDAPLSAGASLQGGSALAAVEAAVIDALDESITTPPVTSATISPS